MAWVQFPEPRLWQERTPVICSLTFTAALWWHTGSCARVCAKLTDVKRDGDFSISISHEPYYAVGSIHLRESMKPRIVQPCVFDLHKFPMKTVDVYQLLWQLSGTINLRGGKVHFVSRLWGFQPTIDGPGVSGPVVRPSTTERVWWSNSGKEGAKGKRKRSGSLSLLHASITRRPPMRPWLPEFQSTNQETRPLTRGPLGARRIEIYNNSLRNWSGQNSTSHVCRQQCLTFEKKKKHWIWKMIFIY